MPFSGASDSNRTLCEIRQMRVRRVRVEVGRADSIRGLWGLLYNVLRINREGASNSCAFLTVQMFLYINPVYLAPP